jgi:hypothetical protein
LLQRLRRRNIQVVGRFVQQQQIRLFEHQAGQLQAAAFTAAQGSDWLSGVLVAEQELAQEGDSFSFTDWREIADSLDGRPVQPPGERLMFLRVVADARAWPDADRALQRLQFTRISRTSIDFPAPFGPTSRTVAVAPVV